MRKLISITAALAALGAIALPTVASADVQRNQEQTATFSVVNPANAYSQWTNVWTNSVKVTVNPCDDTFTGTGEITGSDANGTFDEQVSHTGVDFTATGKFNGDKTVTLKMTRADGIVIDLVKAPMDSTTTTVATLSKGGSILSTEQPVEFKASAPKVIGSTDYKNHGEFVKQSADKNDAAHSCIGMPVQSNK